MAEFKPSKSKEEWASRLIVPLYNEGYIETLWNARKPYHREHGFTLKASGKWALWFFNMRPAGSSPELFYDICTSMAEMIIVHREQKELDMLIGVEMAGIPPVGAVSRAMYNLGYPMKFGYTRPLPKKVMSPIECLELLRKIDANVTGYSNKEYVEGRLEWATNVGILDDMATNLGSKIIARLIVLWQAGLRNTSVVCNQIFYFLNRTRGNIQKGIDFVNETESGLYPASLDVNYIIEMDDHLAELKTVMKPGEFEWFTEFQKNSKQFDGSEDGLRNRREALAAAARGL
ncbi:MAG: hypothetical protein WCV70_03260 [Patescibacteria group bacterium]